ncbi:MAG: hypothetical protein ACOCVT_00815 [bacterium]
MHIEQKQIKPLESQKVTAPDAAIIKIFDGQGRLYHEAESSQTEFAVSGTLGWHAAVALDASGREIARDSFQVKCRTEIQDADRRFEKFCDILRYTHTIAGEGKNNVLFTGGKIYRMHSVASRDNVHAMKGAMYFMPNMKDGIDLHAKYQREDGLVWDFAGKCDRDLPSGHEWRWEPQFHRYSEDHAISFGRQPAENDVEHQHIRGIWRAWKCTGDDAWMKSKLDSGLKAMRFSGSNRWFWSDKYKLLKRPFTIDTWDFVSLYDRFTLPTSGDSGLSDPDQRVYGVMHGDNTGMADACDKLAEMLRFAGRDAEADEAQNFADGLRERLDELAWNGEFFTHHVSEDPSFDRDFGVDESKQVSLSNSYALTRGIKHEQAVAILKTYQRIREEKPESSPGEFYMIFPPFQKGWGSHATAWQYTNGAVTGIVAGELARGAFEHGFEDYGADIMQRWLGIMEEFDDTLPWGLRGKMPETPKRSFDTIDLRPHANADLLCEDDGVPGWHDDPGMDMRELPRGKQTFKEVPFDVIEGNDRRSLLRLACGRENYAETARIKMNRKAASIYFLHAATGGGPIAGEVCFHYTDGSHRHKYVTPNQDVYNAWSPPAIPGRDRSKNRKDFLDTVIAWRGKCPRFWDIGLTAHGMNNPEPEKEIGEIELRAAEGFNWLIVAMTACDAPAFFMPSKEGHGVPEPWQAGALSCALFEGLAGVVDIDRNMQAVRISPRWTTAEVNKVTTSVKYEDGGGYVRYRFSSDGNRLNLKVAGSSDQRSFEILIPHGKSPKALQVNGADMEYRTRMVEASQYLCFETRGVALNDIEIALA